MIVALVYWALRRLIELIVLAFRSFAAKEDEIVVLRHQPARAPARSWPTTAG